MLFVLVDEPGLFVYETVAEAEAGIEAYDADLIQQAFDENGIPYHVHWIRPKDSGKRIFGMRVFDDPGEYRLVPAGEADLAGFAKLLQAHPTWANAGPSAELEAIRSRMAMES